MLHYTLSSSIRIPHIMNLTILLVTLIVSLLSATITVADLTSTVYRLFPDQCREVCGQWSNSTVPCVENTGSLSLTYADGSLSFNGNKIGIYFCVCSSNAIVAGGDCMKCVSDRYCFSPAWTNDTYASLCNGDVSISDITNVQATC